ncbi:amidohydrolase [Allostreptomyces psammosilenae]|uniref:amidohydrolase n=1 Tax=Allostreptomyces psammosilenae TaxID=1892865 RepID=UPI0015CBE4FF|nr:amidohydrolase [Allostreptomyces psammosilenae]
MEPAAVDLAARAGAYRDELIAFRRDVHAHPELGRAEFRTSGLVKARLERAGLAPRTIAGGTGLVCDILPGGAASAPAEGADAGIAIALRADMDALPIADTKNVPYRSTVEGRAHACGHDVHTTVVLGAGLVLAELARAGRLARPVRLLFQPAEEIMPGGALDMVAGGALDGVERIIAVHCDPRVEVGRIGLRTGPITSACDRLQVRLDGSGGHTARPHLTTDMVTAVARMAADLPFALARRVDPRAGLSLVWGRIASGSAANVIPQTGELEGTVRCLHLSAWREAPDLVHELVDHIAATHGAKVQLTYHRGVPPVVNEATVTQLLHDAMADRFGPHAVEDTEQSLGGEDFSWYLERVPGALARLGVRGPTESVPRDLHRGDFDVDERAIGIGVELMVSTALLAAG